MHERGKLHLYFAALLNCNNQSTTCSQSQKWCSVKDLAAKVTGWVEIGIKNKKFGNKGRKLKITGSRHFFRFYMAGISYSGMELRKLPPRFRLKIAQLLDIQDSWKVLMSRIPSELHPEKLKYTTEHINLIERHGKKTGKPYGEILIDEWSTSGKIRPTVEDLLHLLQLCELYRAADYVASDILGLSRPVRPPTGPAAEIPLDFDRESQVSNRRDNDPNGNKDPISILAEKLNNQDYTKGNLINFSIELLEIVTNNFNEELSIGSGAFGKVYKLDLKQRGPSLAIKLLHPASSVAEDQFVSEIQALSIYRHENLVSLIGFCSNGPQFCLIYEFLEGGSLLEAISCSNIAPNFKKVPLSWTDRLKILLGVSKALKFLHCSQEKPLIHRDVKSANVLLDNNNAPKLGDFGLAKSLSSTNQTSAMTSTIFGTSAYMAPEAFRGDISPKMDVFSLGVIILEMLTGLSPYDENREGNDIVTYLEESVEDEDILPYLDKRAQHLDTNQASHVYSIALKCLLDKKHRSTSEQVLKDIKPLVGVSKKVFV